MARFLVVWEASAVARVEVKVEEMRAGARETGTARSVGTIALRASLFATGMYIKGCVERGERVNRWVVGRGARIVLYRT